MRFAPFAAALLFGLLPALASAHRDFVSPAAAEGLAEIEVYDRSEHRSLPIHVHRGQLYVAGEPGHQYEIRLRNRSGERLLAVTSVDGVNVINGETAGTGQSGYVLSPWDSVEIDGWRKSLSEVATFYFTRLSKSYAARTGRPENIGVIGVALFRERQRCCPRYLNEERAEGGRAAPHSPHSPHSPMTKEEADASVSSSRQRTDDKLGTGHGHRETSPVETVDFQRASSTPDQTLVVYYDSSRNLLARGVIPQPGTYVDRQPQPFPNGFVPDP